MSKLLIAVGFVFLNFYIYALLASAEHIPEREDFDHFPKRVGTWECGEFGDIEADVLDRLGATDWLICLYDDRERQSPVSVYIGYHESQARTYDDGERATAIHPPEHCLPGAGWDVIDSKVIPMRSGGTLGEAKRFVIARGDARQLVYFWYQSRGRIIARNHEVILYKFLDRALRSRSDGALVRLTVPIRRGDEARAEAEVLEFASALAPLLPPYLPN
jgi:EpsI family protein